MAPKARAVGIAAVPVYETYKWFNTGEVGGEGGFFGALTLRGRATVMAAGYGAWGRGGSKEMYFYSCSQATVHVTGKV